MNFGIIDIVFALIIVVCCIGAAFKGFIKAVLSKLAIVFGIILAIVFYDDLAIIFGKRINSVFLCKILSAICIFIVVFIIIMIIQKILSKLFSGEILRSLDKTLGFFFGLVGGVFIVMCLLKLCYIQNFIDMTSILNESFFHNLFKGVLGYENKLLEDVKQSTQNSLSFLRGLYKLNNV